MHKCSILKVSSCAKPLAVPSREAQSKDLRLAPHQQSSWDAQFIFMLLSASSTLNLYWYYQTHTKRHAP
jgi:hypothetical protein